MSSQEVPPSFIPSGARRRPQERGGPLPPASEAVGDARAARDAVDRNAAPAAPPSFMPSVSRQTPREANPQPASFTPRSSSSRRASGHAEAPSFSPAPTASSMSASRPAHVRATDLPQMGVRDAAEAAPASYAPARSRVARRSSGTEGARVRSTSRSVSARAGRPSDAAARPESRRSGEYGMGETHARAVPGMSRAAAATRRRGGRKRNPAHVAVTAVALLLAVLVLSVFGAWNWVDARLNKESGWLTSMANTPAQSWLILGSDERDGTAGGSADDTPGFRTDTILVLTKPKNGPSSLVSIPRDSLTQVDDEYMKINAVAMLYGNSALVSAVEQITGQKIDHIAKIKFGGLTDVVDAIGGVELCYDQTVSDVYSELNWEAGCHVVDGATALAFSRMRYADANGDFGRAQRQRQVISAIVAKGSSKAVLGNPAKLMKAASAGLAAVSVDSKTSPYTLVQMALAFKSATGSQGVTGSVYWTDPDYQVDGVGSSVLLDDNRNIELFSELAAGTHAAGSVGTLAENS